MKELENERASYGGGGGGGGWLPFQKLLHLYIKANDTQI